MIYDRTQADVDAAIVLRETKIKVFQSLTASEIETLERGTLTINTLNRIETKQKELQELLNGIGYWDINIINKEWNETQVFDETEFNRIVNNVNVLRSAFFAYADTPTQPKAVYHFDSINSLEKILYDLGEMIDDVKEFYNECGNFQCGEV